jgi:hypothetical protein
VAALSAAGIIELDEILLSKAHQLVQQLKPWIARIAARFASSGTALAGSAGRAIVGCRRRV